VEAMGDSKRRKNRFFAEHPRCCFCGGDNEATTEDHQPARGLFDGRRWPVGYVFPACALCNAASRRDEAVLAFVVRLGYAEAELSQEQIKEWRRALTGMRNNFSDLAQLLTANEKRGFLKERGIERPPNLALTDLPMIALDREIIDSAFRTCALKLFCALYYKHVGAIVPRTGGIFARWMMNVDVMQGAIPAEMLAVLRAQPMVQRANVNLSSQFSYKFAVSEDAKHAFFICAFRHAFAWIGAVSVDPANIDASTWEPLRPFDWSPTSSEIAP
jgi:hypothetical protein